MLSENDPNPRHNGPVLTLAQIIKFIMSSAAETELTVIFISSKDIIPLQKTLSEMGFP